MNNRAGSSVVIICLKGNRASGRTKNRMIHPKSGSVDLFMRAALKSVPDNAGQPRFESR